MAEIARVNPNNFNTPKSSLKRYMPIITGIIIDILLATVEMAIPIFCVPKANKLNVMIKSNPIIRDGTI